MAKLVGPHVKNLTAAIREVISAHQAIVEGIATHAEKHEQALVTKRGQVRVQHAISEGIERANR